MKGSLPHVSMFDYTQGWVVFKQTPTICIKHSLGKSKQFAHFQKSFVSSFLASSAELPAPELVCLNTCPDTWPCKTAPCYRAYHPAGEKACRRMTQSESEEYVRRESATNAVFF
uniref:Uncharacterized protein n=1 Tax=Odontella aurita TaxID=265563 RepID=A0A7S4ISB4_9STRA|mmetsp:Transcript_29393/g.87172  ORF Transcript_29393/g.87172 Transcript_29393/m.87172 type:complete len:114 (+) Transcript_29393:543-884(+)